MKDDGFLDLSDHDSFSMGVPHLTFERLRNEDPVYWTKEKYGRGWTKDIARSQTTRWLNYIVQCWRKMQLKVPL